MKANSSPGLPNIVWPILSSAAFLALWSLMVVAKLVPESILPTPWAVLQGLEQEAQSGRLWLHITSSFARLVVGFAIGAVAGVAIGGVLGASRRARYALTPVLEILRPIPPLAWIPLALTWFGVGEPSKWFLIALTASFPIIVSTMRGIASVPSAVVRAARMMDVGGVQLLAKVLLPAALPDIVTGLRLGWTLGITILVGAEMIAATSGLGFLIIDGMNLGRFDLVIGGILVLGLLSVVTDKLFMVATNSKLLRWHRGLSSSAR